MKFREEKRDLFKVDDKFALAHCISEDCEMGAGIAVDFQKYFKLRSIVKIRNEGVGTCCLVAKTDDGKISKLIFNLITKERYWQKPTFDNFKKSVLDMKKQCIQHDIKYLAMPKIGCGLDRLKWGSVRNFIKETFKDTDIEILVCWLD